MLRRVLLVWGGLCVVGWVVLGWLAESEEAKCRAEHGLFCFEAGLSLVVVAVAAAALWLIGAVVIAIVWKTVKAVRTYVRDRGSSRIRPLPPSD